jgi:hypothetical protein
MQSSSVERQPVGRTRADLRFGLDTTLTLFACGNFIALIRNAGREIVDVDRVATIVGTLLAGQLQRIK